MVNLGDWWMALSGSCFKYWYLFFQSIFGMIVPNHYLISFQLVWNGLTPPTTSCRSWPSDPFSPGRGYWVQKHQPPQCCGFELHCLQSTVEPTGASGFELASHEAQHGRYVWAHSKLKGHWITECIQKTLVTFNNWVFISHCFWLTAANSWTADPTFSEACRMMSPGWSQVTGITLGVKTC